MKRRVTLLCTLIASATTVPSMPFDDLPDNVNVIVSKDGHSFPHPMLGNGTHVDVPETTQGEKHFTIRLRREIETDNPR